MSVKAFLVSRNVKFQMKFKEFSFEIYASPSIFGRVKDVHDIYTIDRSIKNSAPSFLLNVKESGNCG